MTNTVNLYTKKWALLLQWNMINNIRANFLLLRLCLLRGSTWHWCWAEILLYTEGTAVSDTLDTSWFSVVFKYSDHGSRPRTFTLGLCWVKRKTRWYIVWNRVMLDLWNGLRVKEKSKMKATTSFNIPVRILQSADKIIPHVLPGLWSRKSRHPTPTPGNFDYPTPTPTPIPDWLRPSAVLVT